MPIKSNIKKHQETCSYNPKVIKEKEIERNISEAVTVKIDNSTWFNCKRCIAAGVEKLVNFKQKKNVYDHIKFVHDKLTRPPRNRQRHC